MDGYKLLKNDIKIYQQMCENRNYIVELKKLREIVNSLQITSEVLYYKYQMVLPQLEKYNYAEATIFDRLENVEYLNFLKAKIENEKNGIKIIL